MVDAQNGIVTSKDKGFKKEKTHVTFIYLGLFLNKHGIFKVIKNAQLVEEKDPVDQEATLLLKGESSPALKANPTLGEEQVLDEHEQTQP